MPELESSVHAPQTDLSELLLRPDVQQAINELILQLPKLAPLVMLAAKGVDLAKEAITDGDFLGGLEDMAMKKVKPMQSRLQGLTGLVQEAKQRAATKNDYIGVFGLMRMLKDPNVQYALHFLQAAIDIAGERGMLGSQSTVH